MTLDHYVSQVHLKNFYSPVLGERMYAIRKSDLKCFTPNSKGVCGIHDGSTNAYLREDRAVEEFLKTIEPNYNSAVEKLRDGEIDDKSIYTIAGFVAYVSTCSPGAMRVRSGPLKSTVEVTADLMDAKGLIPPPPPELGGASLSELLRSGAVKIDVDPKYPQAIGITSILQLAATFGNFQWEILCNEYADNPFFTSDFPAAIEKSDDPRVLNRIVPLSPDLAIRIKPDLAIETRQTDFSFANFGYCLVVHHCRKTGAQDPWDVISGTTGLSGTADKLVVLRRDANDNDLAFLRVGGRVGEPRDVALRWSGETHRFVAIGETGDYDGRADSQRRVLEVVDRAAGTEDQVMTPQQIADATGLRLGTVNQALRRLRRDDMVIRQARGRYRSVRSHVRLLDLGEDDEGATPPPRVRCRPLQVGSRRRVV